MKTKKYQIEIRDCLFDGASVQALDAHKPMMMVSCHIKPVDAAGDAALEEFKKTPEFKRLKTAWLRRTAKEKP